MPYIPFALYPFLMKSKPRIDLKPAVHSLLLAESAKRQIRPNLLVEKLILEAASPEAKHLVGMNLEEKKPLIAEDAKLPFALSPLPMSELSDAKPTGRKNKPLKPRLSKQPELLAQIAKLKNEGWSGERIGKYIDYPRTTVDKAIEKLRASGAIK